MFRRVILAGASVIALTAAANAADLSPAPSAVSYKDTPYYGVNWTGLYVGVNGGYGWDASDIAKVYGPLGAKPEGGFGGGQIGYNVQRGNIVFGAEADFQGADISGSKSLVVPPQPNSYGIPPQYTLGTKSTLDWFGTVRGRLGYSFDRTLVYATGGLAYGHISDTASCSPFPGAYPCAIGYGTHQTNATGYVVGGGVEHKLNPAWSVKAEYQYLNLGQDSFFAKQTNEDYAVSTVRLGLNYHIGGGFEPLK